MTNAPDSVTPRTTRKRRATRRMNFGAVRRLSSGRWQARYTDSDGVAAV